MTRKAGRRVETAALVVRSVAYGETDLVITALTEVDGKVAALVRGARRGSKRTSGALEPMHTVTVAYEDKGTELVTLKEARVTRPRMNLLGSLEAMEAAGTMLRWARHVFPPKTPEPAAWATVLDVLDALDAESDAAVAELARGGLRLLADVGWGLELERCVRCGTRCPDDASAQVDARQGGVLCRRCGKTGLVLRSAVRCAALEAQRPGSSVEPLVPVARGLVELVESTMSAHTGLPVRRSAHA